jgi:hypothetical protein
MADACSVASYRRLAWTAGWHLREETYAQALAVIVKAPGPTHEINRRSASP